MDTEPIAVALKFGFLAVLYLFLLWVARSAFREMRMTSAPAPEATGIHPIGPGWRARARGALRPVRWHLDRPLLGRRRANRGPLRLRGSRPRVFARGQLLR